MKTTWRRLIESRIGWENVVHVAKDPESSLDKEFDYNQHVGEESCCEFTLWTADRVYFPVYYEGCETLRSVSRNPSDEVVDLVFG
jgi:hypothetical protein